MRTTFAEAIAALEDLAARPALPKTEVGLRRIGALLRALGDPHLTFPAIHVTGSAGKGSTTVMAACILREAGRRPGLFTGPHLVSYTERIAVDGREITPAEWIAYQERVWPVVEQMAAHSLPGYAMGRPTLFEVVWAMACLYFRDRGVACAVVEVGQGGALDATTANAACVGVITNVSLEHTKQLGPTVEAIAAQKAGIIKPRMLAITAAAPPATAVIASAARRQDATLWQVAAAPRTAATPAPEVTYRAGDPAHPDGGPTISIATPRRSYEGLHPGIGGAHQMVNAACAVAAVDAFALRTGIAIADEHVRAGLAAARFPGRLEVVPGAPEIMLDGAQTAAAVRALAADVAARYPRRPLTLLLAVAADKDLEARVPLLAALARPAPSTAGSLAPHTPERGLVVVTEPPYRGGRAAEVAALAAATGARVVVEPDYARAFALARAGTPREGVLLVAGSLYLLGAVRALILPPSTPDGGHTSCV